jgi:ubiquinone/menaquinone biosynthesis C-methylase UbiE
MLRKMLKKAKAAIWPLPLDRSPWDPHFDQWIKSAVAHGVDPNDVGDEAWANDSLADAIQDLYLSYVPAGATVLELGPGTGRLTRHLITRARKLELVDNSKFVIKWMTTYLAGKIEFRTHLVERPLFPSVPDDSVDTVVAHGVFEHLDFDETFSFLVEFYRVLKPGGYVSYNYDTLHSSGGAEWFLRKLKPGKRCIFRFYTPEFMARIAQIAKFEVVQSISSDDRLAHIVLRKPGRIREGLNPA